MEALQRIQVLVTRKQKGGSLSQFNKLSVSLQNQMTDKRSAIIRETSITIQVLAQSMGTQFEILVVKLLSQNSLLKIIQSANKVIAERAHQSIVAAILCSRTTKLIPKVFDEAKNKSPQVRSKVASYFLLMLLYCEPLQLKQNMDTVEEFLQKYLQDAKPEVRQISRLCFLLYKQLVLPSRSSKL